MESEIYKILIIGLVVKMVPEELVDSAVDQERVVDCLEADVVQAVPARTASPNIPAVTNIVNHQEETLQLHNQTSIHQLPYRAIALKIFW